MDRIIATLIAVFLMSCLSLADANVFSMGEMILWTDAKTNNMIAAYQRFNGYGCYCGFGGHGYPVDKVDCCCQAHDECYEALEDTNTCKGAGELAHIYQFKKKTENGKHTIQCETNPQNECSNQLCLCDMQLASCFAKYDSENAYVSKHHRYDRKQRCQEGTHLRADICKDSEE